jgi:hypothetical protein
MPKKIGTPLRQLYTPIATSSDEFPGVGIGWEISEETLAKIKVIEDNIAEAYLRSRFIKVG